MCVQVPDTGQLRDSKGCVKASRKGRVLEQSMPSGGAGRSCGSPCGRGSRLELGAALAPALADLSAVAAQGAAFLRCTAAAGLQVQAALVDARRAAQAQHASLMHSACSGQHSTCLCPAVGPMQKHLLTVAWLLVHA